MIVRRQGQREQSGKRCRQRPIPPRSDPPVRDASREVRDQGALAASRQEHGGDGVVGVDALRIRKVPKRLAVGPRFGSRKPAPGLRRNGEDDAAPRAAIGGHERGHHQVAPARSTPASARSGRTAG